MKINHSLAGVGLGLGISLVVGGVVFLGVGGMCAYVGRPHDLTMFWGIGGGAAVVGVVGLIALWVLCYYANHKAQSKVTSAVKPITDGVSKLRFQGKSEGNLFIDDQGL